MANAVPMEVYIRWAEWIDSCAAGEKYCKSTKVDIQLPGGQNARYCKQYFALFNMNNVVVLSKIKF